MRARNSNLTFWALVVLAAVILPARAYAITYIYQGPLRPIPADPGSNTGWMEDAVIDVNEHLIITDLDVAIDIVHTCAYDLEIMLRGPNNVEICLNAYYDTKSFFKDPNYSHTIFDDEALEATEQSDAPFTGRFRPKSGNLLSTFDGMDAIGQWHLRINDLWSDDRGYLENFELRISVPEPATFILFVLSGCLLRRRN